MRPRIFGPYEAIRRNYLVDEFLDDVAGTDVSRSVYVQANWAPDRFEDEVAWVERVADESGWPHAIVGYADLLDEDVRPQLDRLTRYPRLRGVRMQLHWHENEMYRFAPRPDLALDPLLQRNVARLADYRLAFDLQVFAGQMAGAAELAAACPNVTFVLQHAGMLENLSPEGRAEWRAGMEALAAQPNVVSKLSAFGTFIHRNDAAHIARIFRETVEALRRGPLPLRLELPHREALDQLSRVARRIPGRERLLRRQRTQGHLRRDCRASVPALSPAAPRDPEGSEPGPGPHRGSDRFLSDRAAGGTDPPVTALRAECRPYRPRPLPGRCADRHRPAPSAPFPCRCRRCPGGADTR